MKWATQVEEHGLEHYLTLIKSLKTNLLIREKEVFEYGNSRFFDS